jgi:hypothetical protein
MRGWLCALLGGTLLFFPRLGLAGGATGVSGTLDVTVMGPNGLTQAGAGNGLPINCVAGCPSIAATAPYVGTPLGYQQITSLSSATGLTVPTGATYAVITPEIQAIRWRDDGTNPTLSVGYPLVAGTQLTYSGSLLAIKLIQQAPSATLDVSYYK